MYRSYPFTQQGFISLGVVIAALLLKRLTSLYHLIVLTQICGYFTFMETDLDYWQAHSILEWHVELGVSEAICDAPINRYECEPKAHSAPKAASKASASVHKNPAPQQKFDAVAFSVKAAQEAQSLEDLKLVLDNFEYCDFKKGAQNTVFSDGNAQAAVMIVGDGPSRADDMSARPFSERRGEMLDAMLAAIGLSRSASSPDEAVYLTYAMPWRAPENRDLTEVEINILRPFLLRHIELVQPKTLIINGNLVAQMLLNKAGLSRLRGKWAEFNAIPVMPMFGPEKLLSDPLLKRHAWMDLLEIKQKLQQVRA